MREIICRLMQIDCKKPELAENKSTSDIFEECSYIMKQNQIIQVDYLQQRLDELHSV
jgi:hypothetical protein